MDDLAEYKKLIREYRDDLKKMNENINKANFENGRTI
jgi:hypothetical protein